MMLLVLGLAVAAATAFVVRRAAARRVHVLIIMVLSLPLMPLAAMTLTGDVSRYLPPSLFSDEMQGKDEVILASVFATVVAATTVAALMFWAGRTAWERLRS